MDLNKLRNIGISAHIDSGKTTLTERILYYTGTIHQFHDVRGKDGVGAKMDNMDLEREKGITIQSAATYCKWGENAINIIDTPGHVDFTIEVERALRVLDGAILVLCSVAGVQSQSITVDRQMRRYSVPRMAFINKCDRSGANPFAVTEQLREQLKHNAVLMQYPLGLEDKHVGAVDLLTRKAHYFEGDGGEIIRTEDCPEDIKDEVEKYRAKLVEAVADLDDEVAMAYLEGEPVTAEMLIPAIRKATISRSMTPVFMGSAYKNKGVQLLLDAVVSYLPSPLEMSYDALAMDEEESKVELLPVDDKPLVMLAFKLEDGRYGQLTYCRIYQGRLNKGDFIYNMSNQNKHKVGRLVRMHSDEMHDIDTATAGDIVALFGIDCASGDTFTDGDLEVTMTSIHVPDPVITFAVEPKKKDGLQNFSKALNRFSKEDPTFRVSRDEESGQTIIGGMGELHLEVYIERIRREYGVDVEVGQPQVAYRETITVQADFDYTHKKQTGGSGQYARVVGWLAPSDEGEHYQFINNITGGVIPKEYQPSCDKGFQDQMDEGGLIGFPVVNVKAAIVDGNSHAVDSSDMAFRLAARAAFRDAYKRANPVILEPIMKVEVESPEEFSGSVLGGLNKRRGMITGSRTRQGYAVVMADVPLSEMFGYSNDLRSATQGKAEFSMEFAKYAPVPRSVQEELIKEYQAKRAAENS
ncbi:elongation factor G [Bradymonadaceae bacterium TMQ3]|uniref:Elongation factor G n=1 Tax=Lujinxingia sediminis TaxID=2480984 RepID=A0ABY0CXN7_9DELT|nr:elongation factor G [Lujinxingia sediminis]RDV39576.1 elongation factor G [Bradymonadaceae bacterium TMQ3]RVU48379.1 elongation factor G [Lujinxingia sediminis]TXC77681.1 elongation factor G [Bradymonadales bacterium TMQ1]